MGPSESSFGGNINGIITGTGFPLNIESIGDLTITFCTNKVTKYLSVSNQ